MNFKHIFFAGPAAELELINPFQYGVQPIESIRKQNPTNFKLNVSELMKCDLLVTSSQWMDEPKSADLVTVARIAGIEVYHIQRFLEHVNQ